MSAFAPRLIVITDTALLAPAELVAHLDEVLARAHPGSVMVQLRDRELSARERLALGRALRATTRRHGQYLAVNDRLDLCALLEADALHLGEQSIAPHEARALLPGVWISAACHDPSHARDRVTSGADAIVLSPVVAARKGNAPLGADGLVRARAVLDTVPTHGSDGTKRRPLLYALGGVDAASAAACREAGADGVAAIGAALARSSAISLLSALGILRKVVL
jgi:thiamine-phosphate pyrophosphorylase